MSGLLSSLESSESTTTLLPSNPPEDSIIGRPSMMASALHESSLVDLPSVPTGDMHDLICVGFGPASLAIGIALQDHLEQCHTPLESKPKIAFIERQPNFAWHAGMQIPGAKMQISFVKDLATFRNPRSRFTFLNYLWSHGRLVQFTNLGTFLPSRLEYQEYLRWCAEQFKHLVHYSAEVQEVTPGQPDPSSQKAESFVVTSRDVNTGCVSTYQARHVVLAMGGQRYIPHTFTQAASLSQHIIHSSEYITSMPNLLRSPLSTYRIAVVGGGQSGAEIFCDLQTRFPNASTSLILKSGALRPADDSPFVNEIFDPRQIANVYNRDPVLREATIASEKHTNYGVVSLELLERIYNDLYIQSLRAGRKSEWQHHILRYRTITSVESRESGVITLRCSNGTSLYEICDDAAVEEQDFDLVVLATGYTRNAHTSLLQSTQHLLLPEHQNVGGFTSWAVAKDYSVKYDDDKVDRNVAGVWLQGCNERTHGLSDTLISVLATRGGEIVNSIFGHFEVASQKHASSVILEGIEGT